MKLQKLHLFNNSVSLLTRTTGKDSVQMMKTSRKNTEKETRLFQMSYTALLYTLIPSAIVIVIMHMKAMILGIVLVVRQMKAQTWSLHRQCEVGYQCFHTGRISTDTTHIP
jgi:hypothetical protein